MSLLSSIKKFSFRIIAAIATVTLIATVAVIIISAKDPDLTELGPEPPQLQLQTLQIAPKDNSYGSIMDLGIELSHSDNEIINKYNSGKKVSSADIINVQEILDRYSESMDAFYRLAERPHFADPNYLVPEKINVNTPVPTFINIRDIGIINAASIKIFASEGNSDEALNKAEQLLSFTKKARADNPSLVLVMVANLVDRYTVEALQAITYSGDLSPSYLVNLVSTIDAYILNDKALSDALRSEYTVIRNMNQIIESGDRSVLIEAQKNTDTLIDVDQSGDSSTYVTRFYATFLGTEGAPASLTNALRYMVFERNLLYKPNRTKNQIRKDYKAIIDIVDKPCKDVYPFTEDLYARLQSPDEVPMTESNRFGVLFTMQAYPTYTGLIGRNCDRELDISSTRLALALAAYEQETGKYPSDLGALMPKYIDKIPNDPYSHQPLDYSAYDQTITSVRDPANEADEFRFDLATMQSDAWQD